MIYFIVLDSKRHTGSISTSSLKVGGVLFSGDEVRGGWANYFESLATPSSDPFNLIKTLRVHYEFLKILIDDSVIISEDMILEALQGKRCWP